MAEEKVVMNEQIERMFKAGAHFGLIKSRRHPSTKSLIFGAKNRVEIFDLEKTKDYLDRAKDYVKSIAKNNGTILFIGGKNEAQDAVRKTAESLGLPYVAGRWIGGTFTNFSNIKKRVERLETLMDQREKGELAKYTKKERLLIDREIEKLLRFFGGIVSMKELPKAIFVVDSKYEEIAVTEAKKVGIPVIGLCGTDCDLKAVDYAIPGNDSSISSIKFFLGEIAAAYKEARQAK